MTDNVQQQYMNVWPDRKVKFIQLELGLDVEGLKPHSILRIKQFH